MSRWRMVPLGDVLRPVQDAEAVHPERSYPNLGIFGFGRGVFAKPDITGMDTSAKTLYRVRAGQFIYSRLFAFEGAYAVVPLDLDGCFVSNEFPTFDWIEGSADPAFIAWIFKQPGVWAEIAKLGVGMGDRRRRVHPESLLTFQVPLPPLDEQRRIAARLDAVSSRLKARADAADRQESELAAMLQQAFARLTAGSQRARMADVAPLVRRPVEIEQDGTYEEIGARAFGRGLFLKPTLRGDSLTWQKLFRIEADDLVISNIKAWEGAFAVAEPAHHGKVASHRYLTCVADHRRLLPGVLWFFLQSRDGLAQIQAASPGSADRNRTLAQDRLEAILVPVPPLDAQQWFEDLRMKAKAVRALNAAAAEDAAALLPAMLHQTFSPAGC
ncbi:hypothetical protein KTR66_05160 [Roseococcus sp. SDR]|uniref:hypothetical protein n=1 Tax=Roseococcus sp. SDR TaxID=2835532 RepID=UPI001BD12BC0|nr:hypothetical protein [Roseococcus sp. SDR]MBS7789370.1 hypothetical protein [Roseococcus sp. SDR]MBV1844684.1 hypothetical protein [Roseococcus sp. SDR]